MHVRLADFIKDTPEGREAEAIFRNCVHCGFCTATCPTYKLLGTSATGRAAGSTCSRRCWKGNRSAPAPGSIWTAA